MRTHEAPLSRAFTRLELAILLATLLLLAAIAFPGLASTKPHSERAMCASNLRQIGHAFQLWADDHGNRNPWAVPISEGGTFEPSGPGNPQRNNIYYQVGWVSNELVTPKMLICPSDQGVGAPRRMASDFSTDTLTGGFFGPGYKNLALSYIVGLHTAVDASRSVLSGDRNIQWDYVGVNCTLRLVTFGLVTPRLGSVWTNSIHGEVGNLLFNDGGVDQLSSSGLRRALAVPNQGDPGSHHFLAP